MHLFIQESFLTKFENDYNNENPSIGQKCLHKIFTEYTRVRINFDELNVFQKLDSKYLRLYLGNNPTSLNEIGDFDSYFNNIENLPNQTIVLTTEASKNKDKIQNLGGLCLDYLNYESLIKTIIDKLHFKYSLSDNAIKFTWACFSHLNLIPIKTIVIDDPYILNNSQGGLMVDNLIPLLKNLLKDQKVKPSLTIFSDKIHNNSEKGRSETEIVKARYTLLESELKSIISSVCIAKSKKYDQEILEQHDRFLYTPFTIAWIGKGFNIFPYKNSTSKVEQSTIFDKFYYNELKNHCDGLKKKYDKLAKKEIYHTELKIYPNSDNLKLFID